MPVLAVCLDSVDRRLVFAWAREGQLPALAGMMERGVGGVLRTSP